MRKQLIITTKSQASVMESDISILVSNDLAIAQPYLAWDHKYSLELKLDPRHVEEDSRAEGDEGPTLRVTSDRPGRTLG